MVDTSGTARDEEVGYFEVGAIVRNDHAVRVGRGLLDGVTFHGTFRRPLGLEHEGPLTQVRVLEHEPEAVEREVGTAERESTGESSSVGGTMVAPLSTVGRSHRISHCAVSNSQATNSRSGANATENRIERTPVCVTARSREARFRSSSCRRRLAPGARSGFSFARSVAGCGGRVI